jgi:hypothetical protein
MVLSIMAHLGRLTLRIMTTFNMTLILMTVSIMALNKMTLITMTLRKMTLSIMGYIKKLGRVFLQLCSMSLLEYQYTDIHYK